MLDKIAFYLTQDFSKKLNFKPIDDEPVAKLYEKI
jgi:hypothetical protein